MIRDQNGEADNNCAVQQKKSHTHSTKIKKKVWGKFLSTDFPTVTVSTKKVALAIDTTALLNVVESLTFIYNICM